MNGFIYEQEIERFLNEAIEKDLFEVYYQPVYSIETDHYITMEALSRLWHPTLGYVPPDVLLHWQKKMARFHGLDSSSSGVSVSLSRKMKRL